MGSRQNNNVVAYVKLHYCIVFNVNMEEKDTKTIS